jgi:hypothetical protein
LDVPRETSLTLFNTVATVREVNRLAGRWDVWGDEGWN